MMEDAHGEGDVELADACTVLHQVEQPELDVLHTLVRGHPARDPQLVLADIDADEASLREPAAASNQPMTRAGADVEDGLAAS